MGSGQSSQLDEDDDEEEEEEEHVNGGRGIEQRGESRNPLMKKLLEQEPEMLPCHASASPLSPQLSTIGTPRLGPSIKVWDPYNVLAPPPPPPPPLRPHTFSRSYSSDGLEYDHRSVVTTEVYLINHGESGVNLRPDLVSGRWPEAALTANGNRQARALSVFLNSQGVRFNAVYSSPLDRARTTATSVSRELNFAEEGIQFSDELIEMSQGQWEGCLRSEIYTSEMINMIERFQPDFCAPSGESLRHVELRMLQFLNITILKLPEKLKEISTQQQNEGKGFPHRNSHFLPNSFHDRDGNLLQPSHSDLLYKQRQSLLTRKKSGKSRLQIVTKIEDHETEEDISLSPNESNNQYPISDGNVGNLSATIGVFTHATPIKCLLSGILGCSTMMLHKICIDDSSITVLQHSSRTGWQIKRMNDTAHLRLL